MIEMKLVIDEINYDDIADYAISVVKETFAQKSFGQLFVKHLPETALNHLAHEFLHNLTPAQKDELAIQLITRYKDKLTSSVQELAANRSIHLTIRDLSVQTL